MNYILEEMHGFVTARQQSKWILQTDFDQKRCFISNIKSLLISFTEIFILDIQFNVNIFQGDAEGHSLLNRQGSQLYTPTSDYQRG